MQTGSFRLLVAKKARICSTWTKGIIAVAVKDLAAAARHQGVWHVYYGDVRVGTIAIRTGMPPGEDPWGWACGFYPGSHPGECTGGAAATFDQARVEFEDARRVFLANRTDADFQEWRDQRDFTAEKYRRFDRGERMPPDWRPGA